MFDTIKELLTEARKKNKKYSEKFNKKIAGQLDEVETTFEVTSVAGKRWRDVAESYIKLKKQLEDVANTVDSENNAITADIEDLFDESDKFATRVVRVGELVLKLAKTSRDQKPKEEIDYPSIIKAIASISEEMNDKVVELTKQFTKQKPPSAPKAPALRVTDETTGLNESLFSNSFSHFLAKLTTWFKKIDSQITDIENMFAI